MPDPKQANRLLSRAQAAAHLQMSVRTFDRLKTQRLIPYVKLGERRKYLEQDLDALIYDSRILEEPDGQD